MEIRLSPELQAVVERDMASGRFRSVEDYIAEAVELLHAREQWRGETLEEFNAKLDESIAEAERGELADEIQVRQEMREMKVEWVKARAGT
jgi:Arc/MetJ-type ribon-helix-helix transcriptional regulator